MNVVSLFPTLPASMSQGASPDSRAALPFHASRPQLEEQAGLRWPWLSLGTADGRERWRKPDRRRVITGHSLPSKQSGLRFGIFKLGCGEQWDGCALLSVWLWTLGMSESEVSLLQGQ